MRPALAAALASLAALSAAAADVSEAQRAAAHAALEGTPPVAGGAAEVSAAFAGALADFLKGRYEAAAAGFRYVVTLGGADAEPEADLGLILRELGHPDDAAAHWLKATLLAPGDAFLWNQRAWNYLALGRSREAKDAFRKAAETAARADDRGEAQLGLGLSESLDGNPKAAAEPLLKAAEGDPFARAAANAELARIEAAARRPASALPYAVASLASDPAQVDVARELAGLYEKTGQGKAEWQARKLVLDLDPADEDARRRTALLERWLPSRPEDSLPVTRLGRPIFREDADQASGDRDSPPIRVGLFSGPDERLRHATRFYVMGSTSTQLFDMKTQEEVVTAAPYQQWEVAYRPDNHVIEVRDARGRILYVTKQRFRFRPADGRHTVLVKNIELTDIAGMDIGDREYRGELEVIPTPDGFHLVNALPLDEYLFSVVGESLPPEAPLEAYKAMAVLARSSMLERIRAARPNAEETATCDARSCLSYYGINRERENSAKAVRATRGVTARTAEGTLPERHASCGWATAGGVQDRATPTLALRTPSDLERLLHRGPDEGLYHQASALIPEAWNRWIRVLDAGAVRRRADLQKDVGALRAVTVLGRDATGRVRGLRLTGAHGELELVGLEAIAAVFSPGSLRSELFVVTPLYRGRTIDRFVIWGAGWGHGRGVCVAGAVGQAHTGRRFDQILRHYYPNLALANFTPPPEPVVVETKPDKPFNKPRIHPGMRPPRKRRPPGAAEKAAAPAKPRKLSRHHAAAPATVEASTPTAPAKP